MDEEPADLFPQGIGGLDPSIARFLEMLKASASVTVFDRSLEAYRKGYERLSAFAEAPFRLDCNSVDSELTLPGRSLPIRIYSSHYPNTGKRPGLIWFHGGGWISGNLETSDFLCRFLCHTYCARVISIGYRLAPEAPLPCAFDDACDAATAIISNAENFGLDQAHLAIGGDSAGAQLALIACLHGKDAGITFKHQIMICPVLDPLGTPPSRTLFAEGYLLETSAISDYISFWGSRIDLKDPRFTPLAQTSFQQLPSALIHAASHDPVRDDARTYASGLKKSGVPVKYVEHHGLIHNFFNTGRVSPSVKTALSTLAANIRALRN